MFVGEPQEHAQVIEPILVADGRQLFEFDLPVVESIVQSHWEDGLQAMAGAVCRHWSWQRLGKPDVHGAERVLLALAYRGLVELPGVRARRLPGNAPEVDAADSLWEPLEGRLSDFPTVRLCLVNGGEQESLFDAMIARYHYLGPRRTIGCHLKYLAFIGATPTAALLWGRAAFKLGARDQFIGWTPQERVQGLGRIASNYRFLIPPWIRIRYLASHVLALNTRAIREDWQRQCGEALDYLETFVDPEHFGATCYLAANWLLLGQTRGSGRGGRQYQYHGHSKQILLYPLSREGRRRKVIFLSEQVKADALHPRQLTVLPRLSFQPEEESAPVSSATIEGVAPRFNGQPNLEQLDELANEFEAYCQHFLDLFSRSEPREHFKLLMRGLTSKLEKKNTEYIALKNGKEVPVRTLQDFFARSRWNVEGVRIRHQDFVAQTLGDPNGVFIVDGSDFVKKGKKSAGVSRQYCGASGKIDNCQAGVFLGYAHPGGLATLLDAELYLPEKWFSPEHRAELWKDCHIPSDVTFKTKPELALEMIHRVFSRGNLKACCLLADEAYGNNPAFLDGLPKGLNYLCEVAKTTHVYAVASAELPASEGQPQATSSTVEDFIVQHSFEWHRDVPLKEGAHGDIIADVGRVRVLEVRKRRPGEEVWLFVRRNPVTHEHKYYLSDLSADTPLARMAGLSAMRWPIETCFQEGKDYIGMDHYQTRSWRGWHRHMTMIFLCHHFLTYMRTRGKKNGLEQAG